MPSDFNAEISDFMLQLDWLPPEDRRFLGRLVIELGRFDWTSDAPMIDARILQVTREIAPERVNWVAARLGHARG